LGDWLWSMAYREHHEKLVQKYQGQYRHPSHSASGMFILEERHGTFSPFQTYALKVHSGLVLELLLIVAKNQ